MHKSIPPPKPKHHLLFYHPIKLYQKLIENKKKKLKSHTKTKPIPIPTTKMYIRSSQQSSKTFYVIGTKYIS